MATDSAAKKDLSEIKNELDELLKSNHAFAVLFRAIVDNYKEIIESQKKNADQQIKQQEEVNKEVENQEAETSKKTSKYKDSVKKFGESALKIYEHFEQFHDDYVSEINQFKDHFEKQIYGSVKKGEKIFEGGLLVNIQKFASDPNFGKVLAQRVKDKIFAPFKMIAAIGSSIVPGIRMFGSIGKNLFSFGKKSSPEGSIKSEKTKQKEDNTVNFLSGVLSGVLSSLFGANTGESEGEIESDADRVKRHQEESYFREKVLEYLALIVGQDKHTKGDVASKADGKDSGKGFLGSMLDMVDNILDITQHAKHGWRYLKTNIRWMSRGAYWRGLGTRIIGIMRSPLMRFAGGIAGAAMMAADAIGGVKKSTEWLGKKDGSTTAGKVASGIGGALGGTGPGLFDKGNAMDKAKNIAGGAMKGAAIGMMFGPLGALIGGGIGAVFSAIGGKNIAKALNWVWKGLKSLFGAIWKGISFIAKPIITYAKWVWGIWKKVFGFVFGIFGEIWDAVKSIFGFGKKGNKEGFFTKLWNIAKWLMPWYWAFRIGKALWNWASGLVKKVLGFFGFGKKSDDKGGGIFAKIWNIAKWFNPLYLAYRVGKAIWDWVSGLVGTVLDWFGLGDSKKDDSGDGFFAKIWNIAKWLNPIYLAYKVGEAIWNWVSGMVSNVLSWFGLGDDAEDKNEEGGFWDTILSIANWLNPFKLLGKIANAIIDTLGSFAKKILGWFGIDIGDIKEAASGAPSETSPEPAKVETVEDNSISNDTITTTNVTINSAGDSKYLNQSQLKELDRLVQANEREGLTIEDWVDKYGLDTIKTQISNSRDYSKKDNRGLFLSDAELERDKKFENTPRGYSVRNKDFHTARQGKALSIVNNASKHKSADITPDSSENTYEENRSFRESYYSSDSNKDNTKYVTSTPVFVNQNKANYLTSVAYPVTQ